MSVELASIKDAVKALNETGFLEEKIKFVGVSRENLVAAFFAGIEAVSEEDAAKLPDLVIEVNNALIEEAEAGTAAPAGDAAPAKGREKTGKEPKAPKEKKEKEPKPPKEKKEKAPKKEVEKGPFGSNIGSAANNIDILIAEGNTIEAIMAKAGVTRTRVQAHIKYLKENRNVEITLTGEKGAEVVKGVKKA